MSQLSEQELIRREALEKMKEMGIDPYPAQAFHTTHFSADIKELKEEDFTSAGEVVIAGRLMMKRIMGKAAFAELMDSKGRIQIYVSRDEICPEENKDLYNQIFKKLLDIGDFIGIKGPIFLTKTGEVTVRAKSLTVLSKSLRPLPVVKVDADGKVHDAFSDFELRYRQRYVDLIVNPHVRDIFLKRAKIISTMRTYFDEMGWLEVETPVLQAIHGGAAAKPFETYHNTLDMPLYLRIANELYLKRLIVGGFEGVYEIGKMFRNEGMDRTHNPEFTAVEIYVAYKDYIWMMEMVENLITHIAKMTLGTTLVEVDGQMIDFQGPYKRISMSEAIQEKTELNIDEMLEEDLVKACKQLHIEIDSSMGKGKLIDEIFGATVEHTLIQPTYITDYPIEMTPLAKKHRSKQGMVERFELFVNGKELANAYSELNDPIDQKQRFEKQLILADRGDDEAMVMDDDFIRSLEYGMPPTSGLGIGIDRLTMMLTGQTSIQEVLLFPQMKKEQ